MKNKKTLSSLLFSCATFALLGNASAVVVAFSDTFSNAAGGSGTAAPANWTVTSTNTAFQLQSGDPEDLSLLLDADGDGYAALGKITTDPNETHRVSRSIGNISASDVGLTIGAAFSYLEVNGGATVTAEIIIDGTNVVDTATGSTFGANANFGLLDLTYVIQPSDVGLDAEVAFNFFDSSDRVIGIDAVEVTVVPEPSSSLLMALAALGLTARRRRA